MSGVGQNIAMHSSPTAMDFFLDLMSTVSVHSPSIFFTKISPEMGHPARYHRLLMQVSVLSADGISVGSKTFVIVFRCAEVIFA